MKIVALDGSDLFWLSTLSALKSNLVHLSRIRYT
jgi:hypothetical protein